MFDHENKISFYRDRDEALCIEYRCGKCNSCLDITNLVYELCKYGRDNCPTKLYQAWKVLCLGTSEYSDNKGQLELEHDILISASYEVQQ